MADSTEEKVVMTPKCKTENSTTLVIERKAVEAEASDKIHVAGGDHTGIIINKENVYGESFYSFFQVFVWQIGYHFNLDTLNAFIRLVAKDILINSQISCGLYVLL